MLFGVRCCKNGLAESVKCFVYGAGFVEQERKIQGSFKGQYWALSLNWTGILLGCRPSACQYC